MFKFVSGVFLLVGIGFLTYATGYSFMSDALVSEVSINILRGIGFVFIGRTIYRRD